MKVTVAEAAQTVGRSPWTLKEHIKRGHLHAERTGTGWRNWIVDLDEVIPVLLAAKQRYEHRPHVAGPGRGHHRKVTE